MMIIDKQLFADVFNEWARRYADNPEEFSEILGEDGRPVSDYGDCCAIYFEKLMNEITQQPTESTSA